MRKRRPLVEFLAEQTDLQDEAFPGQPLVEIMGDKRILVEHHCGVTSYGTDTICIRMKYGQIQVCGARLELAKMCDKQLVITGQIDCVNIIRRK